MKWLNNVIRTCSSRKKSSLTGTTPRQILRLTPAAVARLKELYNDPESKLIKVGLKTKGCSGLVYNLEYVTQKGKFDEEVAQDGVKVLVDSKALLSVIGSEMDFVQDELAAQFVFSNPNVKETCGCGLSFMT